MNVCTVSDYAPYLPSSKAERTTQVTEVRALEDQRYAASVPNVLWVDLRWQDAPLRLSIETDEVLAKTKPEKAEIERLRTQFTGLQGYDLVLLPMGLGGHIDHLLVRDAALLAFDGANVVLYEDLPYACRMSPRDRLSAQQAQWQECPLPAGLARSKFAAAMHYPSQIDSAVADEMEAYCAALGHRERLFATSRDAAQALQRAVAHREGAM